MKKFFAPVLILIMALNNAYAGWFGLRQTYNSSKTKEGNHYSQSFYAVKQEMPDKIYYDHRQTLYCQAEFDEFKQIKRPRGFKLPKLSKLAFKVYDIDEDEFKRKAERMEWEHIVPAQNFGKTFKEWSEGHKNCVSTKGKQFKGRSCAVQENETFRYMYTDMYNLYPSIGAVNYLRANFNFTQFSTQEYVKNIFGSCDFKIAHNKVEPRDEVKGLIARTYFYMENTYNRYKIGEPMRGILQAWNKQYPVDRWECTRAYRIEKLQGNANNLVKTECLKKGWYKSR